MILIMPNTTPREPINWYVWRLHWHGAHVFMHCGSVQCHQVHCVGGVFAV